MPRKKPELLDYQETLARVESFLIDTGLRDFCSNVCHGRCCQGCYQQEIACHRNEGRRLACSLYFCQALVDVFSQPGQSGYPRHYTAWERLKNLTHGKLAYLLNGNPYFTVNKPSLVKRFKIPAEIVLKATSAEVRQLVADNLRRHSDVYKKIIGC